MWWKERSKKFQFENRRIRPCSWPLNIGPKSKLFRKLTAWYNVIRTDFLFWIFSDLWIKKNFRKTIREEKNRKIYFWKKYFFEKLLIFGKNWIFSIFCFFVFGFFSSRLVFLKFFFIYKSLNIQNPKSVRITRYQDVNFFKNRRFFKKKYFFQK